MRAVLVLDSLFAARERALISRLEIGLADEGVRVAHAAPWSESEAQAPGLYSVSVGYVPTGLPFTLPQRARMLAESLQQVWDLPEVVRVEANSGALQPGSEEPSRQEGRLRGPIQIVHALGWSTAGALASSGSSVRMGDHRGATGFMTAREPIAWSMARQLAIELGAGLVLEVCEGRQVARAVSWLERSWGSAGNATDTPPIALVCADEAIDHEVRRRTTVRAGVVVSAPWGVHASSEPHATNANRGQIISILLLASDAERSRLTHVLEGFAKAKATLAERAGAGGSEAPIEPMLFVGGDDKALDHVWRLARRLRVLDLVTLVPDLEALREPALSTDLMIVPGGSGRIRTLVLDAMGAAIPVLTGGDPAVSFLSNDSLVWRVEVPASTAAWSDSIVSAVTDRDRTHKIAESARHWVKGQRQASTHVAAVISAYCALIRAAGSAAGSDAVAAGQQSVGDRP